ncbi:9353_t:CDS:2, partial [Racocetra fulgida]
KESLEKHQEHLSSNQNRRLQKRVTETAQERESRLARDRERKCRKARTNTNLQQESERPVISVNIESMHPIGENISTLSQIENINNTSENEEIIIATSQNNNIAEISVELQSATELNEVLPKKFSVTNNMDPGEISEEHQ